MSSDKEEYPLGSPQRFSEDLYWSYSEFENLTVDEVKKCCYKALNIAMQQTDTTMRMYYGECKKIIEGR